GDADGERAVREFLSRHARVLHEQRKAHGDHHDDAEPERAMRLEPRAVPQRTKIGGHTSRPFVFSRKISFSVTGATSTARGCHARACSTIDSTSPPTSSDNVRPSLDPERARASASAGAGISPSNTMCTR